MQSMGNIIRDILIQCKLTDQLIEYDIIANYPSLFPGYIAKNSKPVKLTDDMLMIKVKSSVLRNELKFREIEIKDKINNFLGKPQVNKIRFI